MDIITEERRGEQMAYYVFRINDGNHFKLLREETMKGRLRQGWGAPGMDLRKGEESFIKAWNSEWGSDDTDIEKQKRKFKNLKTLCEIKCGDYIIVPKLSINAGYKDPCRYFTVFRCIKPYDFEVLSDKNDFGHIVGVEILFSVSYDYNAESFAIARTFRAYQSPIQNVWSLSFQNSLKGLLEKNTIKHLNSDNHAKSLIYAIAQDVTDKYTLLVDDVIKTLAKLPPKKFEEVIIELFEKNGFKLLRPNDYDREGGDIDISMILDDKSLLGNIFKQAKGYTTPQINIQAKKKPGTDLNDINAVYQLEKRAETKERTNVNDINIVIDLTNEFQPETERQAADKNIILINGPQFASLLLQFGINGEINE